MTNLCWGIFWFLVLWYISFWVASIAAWLYVWLYCLEVCFEGTGPFCDMLLKCIQFPHYCAQNMVDCKEVGKASGSESEQANNN